MRTLRLSALVAVLTATVAAAPAAARPSADALATLAGARAPVLQLRPFAEVHSFGTRFHRFRQEVGGVPVLGAETVVTDDRQGRGDLLVDRSRRLGRPGEARVTREAAVRSARARLNVSGLRAAAAASLAILPQGSKARLVWRVLLPSRRPLGSFEALVDAQTGAVIRVRDLLRSATGSARIFDPNPVVAQGSRAGLSDGPPNDADSSTLTDLRTTVPLLRLSDSDLCLGGTWARATLPSGNVCAAGAARDFTSVTRSDDRFEALMAYFHADRTQSYIQSLGFGNVLNRQVRIHANESFADVVDSAFYDPATKEITMGVGNAQEGVDTGEDAEVIVHEYGHAVQDDQVPGFGQNPEGGAMGEGFGDYLASAISRTFAPNATFDPCLGEWFTLGLGDPETVPCLRRVDRDLAPSGVGPGTPCDGEVHCAGEAWSGVLWDIRSAIGGTTADRLVIQSHFGITGNAGFAEGARALLSADRQLYGGTHLSLLRDLLVGRGFVSTERLDDTPPEATPLSLPGTVDGQLGVAGDADDVFRLDLAAGRGVVVRLTSAAQELDLRLLKPGTTSLSEPGAVVAQAGRVGSNEELAYVAAESGPHYVDVRRIAGSGAYTLQALPDLDGDARPDGEDNCVEAGNFGQEDRDRDGRGDLCDRFPDDPANDGDGDGLGSDEDNCPGRANSRQTDWDADGRGDVCDRSSRATIRRVSVDGGRLTVVGAFRPLLLGPRAFRVQVARLSCRPACRFRPAGEFGRARRIGRGRARVRLRLSPGSYRLRAVLRARRYRADRSRPVPVRVPR